VRSNSGVDLKAINARLERWADEIASKFKRGRHKKTGEEERLEIHHSVFQAPEGVRPVTAEMLSQPEPGYMTQAEFEVIVESVREAIRQGVHPRMISQGSSGSYFARNPDGKVVGVFKPKDEEPYAAGNPKWNKWIHRNLFPCCFGRACLIPNLSYVSEAAAYVLDAQLRTHMVPYTDVVFLSSKSFHYPFWDRYSYSRNKKTLPAKPGSFQVFLKGFKDANIFLREHPWPDQYLSGFRTSDPHRKRKKRWADACRPTSAAGDGGDSDDGEGSPHSVTPGPGHFVWTPTLKQAFREELEKLVILDYIMRNTDRGLDNWMIKVDWETQQVSIASEPVHLNMNTGDENNDEEDEQGPRPVDLAQRSAQQNRTRASYPYRKQKPMDATSSPASGASTDPKITIGAIDNSLSWPWKHPDAWRSFPFGWLFLPVDLIGRPFSQKTRDHFLPLLTSTAWWSQTQLALRRVFQIDQDFQERMFAKQIAVMKGQAWNVVETLKTADHGPLELTRRAKVCVWDDLVDVPVAVPMRAPSSEMRRRAEAESEYYFASRERDRGRARRGASSVDVRREDDVEEEMEEEMDIGAANSSSNGAAASAPAGAAVVDILGILASPSPADLPHPGRFELHNPDTQSLPEDTPSPLLAANGAGLTATSSSSPVIPRDGGDDQKGGSGAASSSSRPPLARMANSHHGAPSPTTRQHNQRNSLNVYSPERTGGTHVRRYSFANAGSSSAAAHRGRRNSNNIGSILTRQDYYALYGREVDDDGLEEGDLGYAAAEGMEGNQRKVIVERLEPVKTRNPVFTWC